jgi:hypothetical protein
MTNRHRGEVSLVIGGERHVLRLTLQALAEIEAAFSAEDLQALGARLGGGRLKAGDIVAVLGAMLRGGGARLSDDDVGQMVGAADLPRIIVAIGEVFALAFGAAEGQATPNPRQPQRA